MTIRPDPGVLLEAALGYAQRGWRVFPCQVGGKPPLGHLVQHGLNDATTDLDVIRAWWTAEPMANVGLPTGLAFDVLDIDGPAALDALEGTGPLGDPDAEGPTVATPRGWHVYVEATGRGNTVNVGDLKGVDWRGIGGYVVAPPSMKADGTRWEWIIVPLLDLGPDTAIVPAPGWVLALFDRRVAPVSGPSRPAGRTAYGTAALERELGRLVMAAEGTRNHTLNRAAFSLGQLVAGGDLSVGEVGDALLNGALRIGLGETESVATIKSGLRKGLTTPRSSKVS